MILSLQDTIDGIDRELNKQFDFYKIDGEAYSPHRKFHELGKVAKERAFFAGNRVWKTTAGGIEGAAHLTGIYPENWMGYKFDRPIKGWVCSVTYKLIRDLERRFFYGEAIPRWIDPELVISKNRSEHIYEIRHVSGGISILEFKTYKQDREDYQGAAVDWVHFDEEPPHDIYTEALTRTTAIGENQHRMMITTATPLKGITPFMLHFLTRKNEERPDEEIQVSPEIVENSKAYVLAGWENAPHIGKEEQKRLIQSYSPHEIEARTKGIPSLGSGMVYPVPESIITCPPFEIPDHWPRVFGLDFGWKDPTAALFAAHDRDNDVVYIYGEYGASELTPQHHANELIKQGANWMMGVYDPSGNQSTQKDGTKLADLYRQSGIRHLTKADNSREPGILKVLQRFQNNKLYIVNTLHKTLREYRMYARKEGIVTDGNDHFMDCLRYIIASGLSLARTRDEFSKPWKDNGPQRFVPQTSWMR